MNSPQRAHRDETKRQTTITAHRSVRNYCILLVNAPFRKFIFVLLSNEYSYGKFYYSSTIRYWRDKVITRHNSYICIHVHINILFGDNNYHKYMHRNLYKRQKCTLTCSSGKTIVPIWQRHIHAIRYWGMSALIQWQYQQQTEGFKLRKKKLTDCNNGRYTVTKRERETN